MASVGREFGIRRSAISPHLKGRRDPGFARVQAEGPRRIYAIDATPIAEVDEWLARFRRFWEPKLGALAVEVARGKRQRRK